MRYFSQITQLYRKTSGGLSSNNLNTECWALGTHTSFNIVKLQSATLDDKIVTIINSWWLSIKWKIKYRVRIHCGPRSQFQKPWKNIYSQMRMEWTVNYRWTKTISSLANYDKNKHIFTYTKFKCAMLHALNDT